MDTLRETTPCSSCGYGNDGEALNCSMCGELLSVPNGREARLPVGFTRAPAVTVDRRIGGLPEWLFYVLLFGSLVISEESRQWYLTHGSFGLENDFVRIARMLSVTLPTVALPMLFLSLTPLPAAWWVYRRSAIR